MSFSLIRISLLGIFAGTITFAADALQDPAETWKPLKVEIERIGGKIEFEAGNPLLIDLYNGNNPLKGRGGKNDMVNDAWLEKWLTKVLTLKSLSLANCEVTDAGMASLGNLTELESLNLTLTTVTDEGFKHFGALTNLHTLGLASSKCAGEGFKHLKAKNLKSVNFHFTPLNDKGLEAICKVGVTDRFWFAHSHFTDEGARHLSKLTKLDSLGIGSTDKGSSGKSVAYLAKLPLRNLSLLDRQADSVGLAHATRIKTLLKLDLGHAPSISDQDLMLVAAMPKLEEFLLGGASKVTEAGIASLGKSKSLRKLTLRNLRNVNRDSIDRLAKERPKLEIVFK
ncbi:MAG: hypothetical protein O3A82_04940 [Verrucomicrobia bacterium]|jgi:Leucine-rich repeat (LRR) protein|nr:hypothetical protein [Verrucomicrobiota bacterium]MDA0723008.1 hypothetical protein [Verrucomicrobiota bacterium]MDA1046259.1 hypothetical protein [Verrucomicrobiota bacterium]